MDYKFLKISRYYNNYLNYFYTKLNSTEMTYNELLKEFMSDHYIYGDSFSKYLKEYNYETFEIVFNDIKLQKKWADENGFSSNLSLKDILFNQIKAIKPNIIFWDGFEDYDFVNHIKDNVKSIKLNFSQIGVPINNIKRFEPYDFVLSCLKSQVKQLEENGKKAVFFRHGFDESLIDNINYSEKSIDFSFIGSIYSGSGAHQGRANYIEYLTNYTDLTIYSSFKNSGIRKNLKYKTKKLVSAMYNCMPTELKNRNVPLTERMNCWRKEIPCIIINKESVSKFRQSIFGMDMLQALADSKVSLNVHIDIAGSYAASIRMYEITGVGTCLLTDFKDDIKEYFEPDYEIVTFKSPLEALEKYNFLINNPDKMNDIAKNGQKRTLKEHTMKKRIEELDLIIRKHLGE